MRIKLTAALAASLIALPAAAQDEAGRADGLIDALVRCRAVDETTQRLACLDAAADAILAARDKREVVIIDREGVRQAKRSLFGFSLPKIRLFGKENDSENVEPEVSSIDSTITDVRLIQRTIWSFRLADGSHWQTTGVVRFQPRVGDTIRIEAGILGSYIAKVGDWHAGKVKRVR